MGFALNCGTNLVSLTKPQRGGMCAEFQAGTTKMIAKHNGRKIMFDDSSATGICELSGKKSTRNRNTQIVFLNEVEGDSMKLVHKGMYDTAVRTPECMEKIGAATVLGIMKSDTPLKNICEACIDRKASKTSHCPREQSTSKFLELM